MKFKFAKTQFHSGRIQIVYTPGYGNRANGTGLGGTGYATATNAVYMHREIVDVREGNEFEFYFPYVAFNPYLPCGQPFGSISIFVINPLKAPATVASTVNCAVEIRGAKDVEYFQPVDPMYLPSTAVAQSGLPMRFRVSRKISRMGSDNFPDNVVAQAGMPDRETRDDCKITTARPIGGSRFDKNIGTQYAEACVGEQVRSVKQLAMRACFHDGPTSAATAVRPFAIGALPKVTTGNSA